jgi:hypothetical protein
VSPFIISDNNNNPYDFQSLIGSAAIFLVAFLTISMLLTNVLRSWKSALSRWAEAIGKGKRVEARSAMLEGVRDVLSHRLLAIILVLLVVVSGCQYYLVLTQAQGTPHSIVFSITDVLSSLTQDAVIVLFVGVGMLLLGLLFVLVGGKTAFVGPALLAAASLLFAIAVETGRFTPDYASYATIASRYVGWLPLYVVVLLGMATALFLVDRTINAGRGMKEKEGLSWDAPAPED